MFPIWIAGYLAYIYKDVMPKIKNYYTFFLSILLTYLSYIILKPLPFHIGYKPFYHANQFLTDNISGVLFAFTLWVFPENNKIHISPNFVKKIRKIADYTFPIYVLHYPILKLCKLVFIDQFYLFRR